MALVGRVAMVTGAANGIGLAVCQRLRASGASVFMVDLHEDGLAQAKAAVEAAPAAADSARVLTQAADVADWAAARGVVAGAHSSLGRIDALVNSAGITRDNRMLAIPEEDWDAVLDVNLKGTFVYAREVAAVMEAAKAPGSIVNISSIVGKAGNFGQANYAASKAGVIGLTKTLSKELGKSQIRCNAILPGFIKTQMTDAVPDKVIAAMTQQIPLRRLGEPSDIANMAHFLVGDESAYITGGSFEVTGGLLA